MPNDFIAFDYKDEILKMVAPIGFVLIISSVFEFLLSLKLPTTKTKKITDNFGSLFENKRTKKLQMIYIDQWWNLQLTDTANNWK
jgi:hypothetical protein